MQNSEAIDVAARAVIRQHGHSAVDHARRMARRYTKVGDKASAREWLQIMRAIAETESARGKALDAASGIVDQAKPAA